MKVKYATCEKCKEVITYECYSNSDTDFPKGEWIVHNSDITTGFDTPAEAQEWLNKRLAKKASRRDEGEEKE
jgi:hypothetical protein